MSGWLAFFLVLADAGLGCSLSLTSGEFIGFFEKGIAGSKSEVNRLGDGMSWAGRVFRFLSSSELRSWE